MYLCFTIIELIFGYFAINNTSYAAVCLVLFEKAFLFQGIMTAANLILTEKFENGMAKAKYLAIFRLAAAFIYAALA